MRGGEKKSCCLATTRSTYRRWQYAVLYRDGAMDERWEEKQAFSTSVFFLLVFIFLLYTQFFFTPRRLTHSSKENFIKTKAQQCNAYLCTLGYFISEMILVASVWLCFKPGGHMLSTQSTWSTYKSNQSSTIQQPITVFYHLLFLSFFFESFTRFVTSIKPLIVWYTARVGGRLPLWDAWWGSPAWCGWTPS